MSTENKLIIEPRKGWQLFDINELFQYRDLFYFLVLRDIKVIYKQTVMGFTWAIARPFFSMIIFSVVFGKMAKVPSDGVPYPIFVFVALVPWTYFSTAITKSTESLIMDSRMLTKIYFPRIVIPMTPVIAGLVDFTIAFALLIGLMVWYGIIPTFSILLLPFLILLMVFTASGIGMLLSSLAIQYRDVKYGIQFFTPLLMYAAPIVWPMSLVPEKYRLIYGIYPMGAIIEGFRSCLLNTNLIPWDLIAVGSITSILIFIAGALYFRQMERFFADVA